jgi:hypothetical protein
MDSSCFVLTQGRLEGGVVPFLGRNFINAEKIIMDKSHARKKLS